MINFNKTEVYGDYIIELKVFGDEKGSKYASK